MLHEADKKLYKKLGLEAPAHFGHFTEEEREKYKVHANHKWSQKGNQLYCTCELGTHTSVIPVDRMLTGTDDAGLPILTKVVIR